MDTRDTIFFAKSPDANGHQETVGAHLRKVAELAAVFGAETGQEAAARLAGLWHDFGKYSRDFQEVLLGVRHGVDHSLPGAAFLDLAGGERLGREGEAGDAAVPRVAELGKGLDLILHTFRTRHIHDYFSSREIFNI